MKIDYLIKAIQQSEYLVALGGLNMMREVGISHYHDKDEAYRIERKYGYSPEELFSARCFATNPEKFYNYYKDDILSQNEEEPGPAYYALARLEAMGRLKYIITREIYNLPQRAGCKKVINLHGNIYENNHCPRCLKQFTLEYIKKAEGVPLCDECNIPLHPGVRLVGEMVDNHVMSKAAEEVAKADVLLVLGLHLKTELCRECIQYFQGQRLILINSQEHYADNVADMVYHDNVQTFFPKVVDMIQL